MPVGTYCASWGHKYARLTLGVYGSGEGFGSTAQELAERPWVISLSSHAFQGRMEEAVSWSCRGLLQYDHLFWQVGRRKRASTEGQVALKQSIWITRWWSMCGSGRQALPSAGLLGWPCSFPSKPGQLRGRLWSGISCGPWAHMRTVRRSRRRQTLCPTLYFSWRSP